MTSAQALATVAGHTLSSDRETSPQADEMMRRANTG
jgi:hypothetical protein